MNDNTNINVRPCPICGSTGACPEWCLAQQEDPRLAYHRYDCAFSGYDCERGCNCYGCRHYEHYEEPSLQELAGVYPEEGWE